MPATTATPRAEKYLYDKVAAAVAPLKVYRSFSGITARHVRYSWQGSGDVHYVAGVRVVRNAFLVYVAQAPTSTATVWAQDLQADADKIDAALNLGPVETVNGRVIDGCRRDGEHYFEQWEGTVLREVQLGGMYLIWSSVAP
jgi:hypothetical protein